jgi:hypothetical protein
MELPSFRLTKRDIEIIKAVYFYRALTTTQIEALLFKSSYFEQQLKTGVQQAHSPTRCNYRLQKLYHYGYLRREELPQRLMDGRKPYVYFPDIKALNFLAHHELLDDEENTMRDKVYSASYPFLQHLLDINTIRIVLILAAKREGWEVSNWIDEKTLKQAQNLDVVTIKSHEGKISKASVIPDGFFTLKKGSMSYSYFLELDRSTETGEYSTFGRRDFARKIRTYGAYLTPQADGTSMFEKRYHLNQVRILTITTGEKRVDNLKMITERVGGANRYWFTWMKQCTPDTILSKEIWQIASREGLYSLMPAKKA